MKMSLSLGESMEISGRDIIDLEFVSTLDGSREKALFHFPAGRRTVPLVVGLHTWSYNRFNQLAPMLPFCRERGWALLLPEFRGPNLSNNQRACEACASPSARQDILDTVEIVANDYPIDRESIFLLGGSGGGHMALMMAAQAPSLWKGVSSWVPITDLAAWHGENPDYAGHVAACCGGEPGKNPATDREYRDRSPIYSVRELADVTLSLHHGRFDPLVSFQQSWRLAEKLVEYGAERFFFEIFNGGHELQYDRAFQWFDGLLSVGCEAEERLTG
jgi:dipeptidyl aminopeptidase/acylaminoacyl peptidase